MTGQAAEEMKQENPDPRFRRSMYAARPPARFGKIPPAGPRHGDRRPPDMLHNVLDQETRVPAETARDLLPGEQWDRLRNAAKEELQRKIQDPGPGA